MLAEPALSRCRASLDFALSIRPLISPGSTAGRTRVTFITYRVEPERVRFFHVGVEVAARRNNSAAIGGAGREEGGKERGSVCSSGEIRSAADIVRSVTN